MSESIRKALISYEIKLPRKILFGIDSLGRLGSEARVLTEGRCALIVTDENIVRIGIARRVEDTLLDEGFKVEVFDKVEPEPSIDTAEAISKLVRSSKFDLVVGVGGGSVMDMAKIASIASTNLKPIRSYIGVNLVEKPGLPHILVPTTAGTGSEVTDIAVVTIPEDEIKSSMISPYLLPDVAIVDPSLTYTLPPSITASTGLDAISHALEALMSVNSNHITDIVALEALRLAYRYLPEAYRSSNPENRYYMSLAALLAGIALCNAGVCLGHALAYTFAVSYRVPHGVSCGLTLPYAFEYNSTNIGRKIPSIAKSLGIDVEGRSIEELSKSITDHLFELVETVGIPTKLREIGIDRNAIPTLASKLLSLERLLKRNPKAITINEALKIVESMW
ncbi:MAG: iron-containing alcohol dehydrogenase [Nitrososphaerota archaeon]|nr:iron-containing alcohol dehydrogenase [Candidatus Bathyarchaeota archaeon]MDW8061638.1 iron-containing alcohol dehydrogenase [Nitrososphaerota archaeon]